jgi:hypothetical protein
MRKLIASALDELCYGTELYKAARQQSTYAHENTFRLNHRTRVYSMGAALLENESWKLIAPDNYLGWIYPSAQLCLAKRMLYERRVPVLRREYSEFDQKVMKYSLHGVLSLGNRVLILLVDSRRFIVETFEHKNVMFIAASGMRAWVGSVGYGGTSNVQSAVRPTEVEKLSWLMSDQLISKTHDTFVLQYDRSSFKTGPGRTSALHAKYARFLHFLQGGRCALCNDELGKVTEVDHVYPVSRKGNNTLINLELLHKKCNRHKCDSMYPAGVDIAADKEILTRSQLAKTLGLPARSFYCQLADRQQEDPPFFPILFT